MLDKNLTINPLAEKYLPPNLHNHKIERLLRELIRDKGRIETDKVCVNINTLISGESIGMVQALYLKGLINRMKSYSSYEGAKAVIVEEYPSMAKHL